MALHTITSDPRPSKHAGYQYVYYNEKTKQGGEKTVMFDPKSLPVGYAERHLSRGGHFDERDISYDENLEQWVLTVQLAPQPQKENHPVFPPDGEEVWPDEDTESYITDLPAQSGGRPKTYSNPRSSKARTARVRASREARATEEAIAGFHTSFMEDKFTDILRELVHAQMYASHLSKCKEPIRQMELQKLVVTARIEYNQRYRGEDQATERNREALEALAR